METTARPDPIILILADGDSDGAVSHKRGHLFEQFTGRLFEKFGYEEPTRDRLQVYAHGIELDLRLRHRLSGTVAIIECKAYSSPVRAAAATSFYATLSAAKLDDPAAQGFLVALPRLTAEGKAVTDKVQVVDKNLHVLIANDVADALSGGDLIEELSESPIRLTDAALVITEHGLFSAAIEIDDVSRLGIAVRVGQKTGQGVPSPVVRLLEQSDYARGLPVLEVKRGFAQLRNGESGAASHASQEPDPVIATVAGSTSDFEYQLPAAPRYFADDGTP